MRHKSLTFDKAGQDALPQHVKDKMKANQVKARIEIEVGQVYQSVNGAKVKIHHVEEPNQYPFLATVEYIDGTYFIPTKETEPVSYSYNGQSNRAYRGFDIVGTWDGGDLKMYVPTETPFEGSVLQKEIINHKSNELRRKMLDNIENNILSKKVSKFWSDAADLLADLCKR